MSVFNSFGPLINYFQNAILDKMSITWQKTPLEINKNCLFIHLIDFFDRLFEGLIS